MWAGRSKIEEKTKACRSEALRVSGTDPTGPGKASGKVRLKATRTSDVFGLGPSGTNYEEPLAATQPMEKISRPHFGIQTAASPMKATN